MKKDRVNLGQPHLGLTPAWAAPAAGGSGNSTRRSLSRWFAASGDANQEPDDTIEVQRRRPTGESSGPRERAEAPVRRKTDSGGGAPPPRQSVIGWRLFATALGPTTIRRPAHAAQPEDPADGRTAVAGSLRHHAEVLWRRGYAARRSRRSHRCSPNRRFRRNPAPALNPSQRSPGRRHRRRPGLPSPPQRQNRLQRLCWPRPVGRLLSLRLPQHRARRGP